MVMLVSLEQASEHLRRDTNADDADLILKIEGASSAVINYLKSGATFLDSAGEVDVDSSGTPLGVPNEVRIATLMLIRALYDDGTTKELERLKLGYLPVGVIAMLYPLRDPAMS